MPVPIGTVPTLDLSTPLKEAQVVLKNTPETLLSGETSSSSSYSLSDSSASSDSDDAHVETQELKVSYVSDHKREELAGEHFPEPLLQENPGRFVLFPIQHTDVSVKY